MKYKLKIFIKVAEHLSFTLASKELNLSQPAVSKTISKLEEAYNVPFFHRSRNAISLTNEGKIFLDYARRISQLYDELENTFLLNQSGREMLFTFGLSTTIATYVMPKVLAKIQHSAPEITFNITAGNTQEIEQKILDQKLEYGIVEGKSSNQFLNYTDFARDEIVLVTGANNANTENTISKKKLSELPFIGRETGSGTRDIIEGILRREKVKKLKRIITLDSTEAIIRYLQHSDAYALLSIHAVSEQLIENKLRIVDIKGLGFERRFYFVCRTGYQSGKMDLLLKMIRTNYNF